MRYIKVFGETQFCGTAFELYLKTDMTDGELYAYASELALENAEQYDYMVFGWGEDAESYAEDCGISIEEAEELMENYYADVYGDWEEVTEEEYRENC